MNEERDNPESSYRPSSPDLSGLSHANAPLPRLNRIPSYHVPDQNLPQGYSFSPRGSYDASPFFSPSSTTPSTSYFGSRSQIPNIPHPHPNPQPSYSPKTFRTPSLPPHTHTAQSTQFRLAAQPSYHHPVHSSAASHYIQPSDHQSSFDSHPNPIPQDYYQHPGLAHSYGDMPPRTRQARAAEELDQDYNPNGSSFGAMPIKAEPPQAAHPIMPIATTDPGHGIDVRTKFPVARIKRIMQADEDVGKVAQATPTAVSKALELFMITLVSKGAAEARANNSKRVSAQHLKAALMKDGQFDFLTEICENVPDEGSKKGRAKSEAKSEDSDEDIAPKKKAKGGRKRKAGSDDDSD